MPFVFLIFGSVFVASGIQGHAQDLMNLVQTDLKGPNNFVYWILSILAIGALGYAQDLRAFSRGLLALVLIVLVVSENKQGSGGLFVEFQSAVKQITGG